MPFKYSSPGIVGAWLIWFLTIMDKDIDIMAKLTVINKFSRFKKDNPMKSHTALIGFFFFFLLSHSTNNKTNILSSLITSANPACKYNSAGCISVNFLLTQSNQSERLLKSLAILRSLPRLFDDEFNLYSYIKICLVVIMKHAYWKWQFVLEYSIYQLNENSNNATL